MRVTVCTCVFLCECVREFVACARICAPTCVSMCMCESAYAHVCTLGVCVCTCEYALSLHGIVQPVPRAASVWISLTGCFAPPHTFFLSPPQGLLSPSVNPQVTPKNIVREHACVPLGGDCRHWAEWKPSKLKRGLQGSKC